MVYQADEELKTQIKHWFKAYGMPILAGVLLGVFAIGGWQVWQRYNVGQIETAARLYQEMMDQYVAQKASSDKPDQKLPTQEIKQIESLANKLKANYTHTHYSFFAAMVLAKQYSQDKNYQQAAAELQWVLDHSKDNALNPIVKLRLAELLWQQDKIIEAQDLLTKALSSKDIVPGFVVLYQELLGDIALSGNDRHAAKAAYQAALTQAAGNPIQAEALRNKVNYLADIDLEPVRSPSEQPADQSLDKSNQTQQEEDKQRKNQSEPVS